jgi:hypothetical protein
MTSSTPDGCTIACEGRPTSTRTEDLVELRREVRLLAHVMVRFEQWEREARETHRWHAVAQYMEQRDLAQLRRSALLREVWDAERESD